MIEAAGLILNILLAFFKAVPVAKAMWDRLLLMYIERESKRLEEEIRLGIYNAVHQKDQRGIEEAIGAPNAGKPVQVPDSQIVDSLPGVTPHPPRNK
jgi:hypothetical protein